MTHEEFEVLAARHQEGLATEEEQQLMDEHVRSCAECLTDVAEAEAAPAAVADETIAARRRRPFFRWWLGAAALFFLALFGWSELRLRVQQEDALQLKANLARLTTENARLFRGKTRDISTASVIAGPNTRIVTMASPSAPEASARAFLDPESRHGYVFAHGLAPNRYRLLAIHRDGTTHQKLSSFEVKSGGDAAVRLDSFPDLQNTATLAIALDSEAPAPAPVLSGTF